VYAEIDSQGTNIFVVAGALKNKSVPNVGGVVRLKVTKLRLVQPLNALLPILVTLFGIVMDSSLVQPLNALSPILVTLPPIVIDVRFVHPLKAPSFIPKAVGVMLIVLISDGDNAWRQSVVPKLSVIESLPVVVSKDQYTPPIIFAETSTTGTTEIIM
jgi:hypothetical protein